ncbi:hypothetical protein ACHAWO_007189 [Cyclotella atomus]|uniref:Uncharacterized protein n=1 Tax=Cyclotella atomus TaxID=382360 RepID=A0ABD3QZQ0_9STRA
MMGTAIQPSSDSSDQSTSTRAPSSVTVVKSTNAHKILYPMPNSAGGISSIMWTGLEPLDMVERIAKMAISSSNLNGSSGNSEELKPGCSFLQYLAGEGTAPSDFGAFTGLKRKRDSFDDYDDDTSGCDLIAASVLDEQRSSDLTESTLTPWKPYTVLDNWTRSNQCKITDKNALLHLNHLVSIIKKFEQAAAEPKNKWCIPSYDRVQLMFTSNVASLSPDGDVFIILDGAVRQIQALIQMVQPVSPNAIEPRVKFTEFVSCNDGSKQLMAKPNPTRIMNGIVLSREPLSEKAQRQVFTAYLTEWLCQSRNWMNPYPDETVLKQMAHHFIHIGCIPGIQGVAIEAEAISKISTWLLNTRTRRWRPALERAFDGKRPAMLLMEDSLRVFKGDVLRPVIGWDGDILFAERGEYSKPIATWDMKKSSRLGSASSSNAEVLADNGGMPDLFPQAPDDLTSTLDGLGLLEDGHLFGDDNGQDCMLFAEGV